MACESLNILLLYLSTGNCSAHSSMAIFICLAYVYIMCKRISIQPKTPWAPCRILNSLCEYLHFLYSLLSIQASWAPPNCSISLQLCRHQASAGSPPVHCSAGKSEVTVEVTYFIFIHRTTDLYRITEISQSVISYVSHHSVVVYGSRVNSLPLITLSEELENYSVV